MWNLKKKNKKKHTIKMNLFTKQNLTVGTEKMRMESVHSTKKIVKPHGREQEKKKGMQNSQK